MRLVLYLLLWPILRAVCAPQGDPYGDIPVDDDEPPADDPPPVVPGFGRPGEQWQLETGGNGKQNAAIALTIMVAIPTLAGLIGFAFGPRGDFFRFKLPDIRWDQIKYSARHPGYALKKIREGSVMKLTQWKLRQRHRKAEKAKARDAKRRKSGKGSIPTPEPPKSAKPEYWKEMSDKKFRDLPGGGRQRD